jgi:peptidoglycan/xylan/chitin deacetylase (PgdA/CDA1 family)
VEWAAVAIAIAIALAVAAVLSGDGQGFEAGLATTTTRAATTSTVLATTATRHSPTTTTTAPTASSTTAGATSSTTRLTATTVVGTPPAVAVWRGNPSVAKVALTFDAGSDAGYAGEILDTLHRAGIRASFGVTGRWAEQHPELVARMVADGHQLLNHSYDHPSFTGRSTDTAPLPRAQRLQQLARTESAIFVASGTKAVPWFRPPYGDEDASVRADVALAGYRYEAMWTVDSLGWKGAAVDSIVDRCLSRAENGAIYLFHVGAASADHAALQAIIDGLRARGYSFGTLAQVVD